MTETALDKFVVGNRVVICEALDTDSPIYESIGDIKEHEDQHHGCCHSLLILLIFVLKIPLNYLFACTKPFTICKENDTEKRVRTSKMKPFFHLASKQVRYHADYSSTFI